MAENRKVRVAITHGDTNGIGYELIFKTFAEPEMLELCTPVVYGSPKVAAYHRKALNSETAFSIISSADDIRDGRLNLLTCFDEEVKVELSVKSEEAVLAGVKALKKAIEDSKDNCFDSLVLSPLSKNSEVKRQGLLMLMNENLRVAFATADIAQKDVASKITKELVVKKAEILFEMLKRDLRITNPRVAVLSLNPDGNGVEETEAIIPAVKELVNADKQAFGPYTVTEFFGTGKYPSFDAVLAMYYDQGAAPFHMLTSNDGIALVAGLPIPCTMPLADDFHALAGKGQADENSFRHAIYTAIDIYRNRCVYDEATANPLPKLFHERRDESEKVRFSIPKKAGQESPKEEVE